MNKAELILEVAERANLSKGEAENAVEEMLAIIERELVKGNEVKLSGFGIFSKKTRLERKGTNPSSGDIIVIPENNTVSFKPSKILKEKVN
ncbi:MAG: HU family DNA-binding protein [Bacilli bacterium]|nr:HU family DNA-binding protein [Bacilli bacterium]